MEDAQAEQLDDAKLASKIRVAMKDVDVADARRREKFFAAGRLLIEAQKRHPTEKAFANFLQLAGGIQIRRAQDLINFARGRKDFEKHRLENKAAQQRYRDKKKAEKIQREKEKAALPKPEPKPDPKPKKPEPKPALRNAGNDEDTAARNLREFEYACRTYLPRLSEADLKKASAYFNSGAWKPKTDKEAAA